MNNCSRECKFVRPTGFSVVILMILLLQQCEMSDDIVKIRNEVQKIGAKK